MNVTKERLELAKALVRASEKPKKVPKEKEPKNKDGSNTTANTGKDGAESAGGSAAEAATA